MAEAGVTESGSEQKSVAVSEGTDQTSEEDKERAEKLKEEANVFFKSEFCSSATHRFWQAMCSLPGNLMNISRTSNYTRT